MRFQKLMWRNMMRSIKSQKKLVLHYSIDIYIYITKRRVYWYDHDPDPLKLSHIWRGIHLGNNETCQFYGCFLLLYYKKGAILHVMIMGITITTRGSLLCLSYYELSKTIMFFFLLAFGGATYTYTTRKLSVNFGLIKWGQLLPLTQLVKKTNTQKILKEIWNFF